MNAAELFRIPDMPTGHVRKCLVASEDPFTILCCYRNLVQVKRVGEILAIVMVEPVSINDAVVVDKLSAINYKSDVLFAAVSKTLLAELAAAMLFVSRGTRWWDSTEGETLAGWDDKRREFIWIEDKFAVKLQLSSIVGGHMTWLMINNHAAHFDQAGLKKLGTAIQAELLRPEPT